ncbi:MAG: hypothetical protein A3K10_15940 [Bacteroidetes bacterium RIFCSPLOWO2_12_FULL_31_6]|nr:MAG: hypothetical protein A3K10_15940 [Bacteroidetes bacterium RIFCSPLOWO2_12_FULL_31_6]
MNFIKEIDLEKSVITLYDNRIVKIKFKDGVDFQLDDAIIANQTMFDIVDGNHFLSLVDTLNVRGQISNDAMKHFAKDPLTKGVRIAEAIVVDSLHNRILANFYLKFVKSHNPVKVFNNMDKAIVWLLEMYQKNY